MIKTITPTTNRITAKNFAIGEVGAGVGETCPAGEGVGEENAGVITAWVWVGIKSVFFLISIKAGLVSN